MVVDGSGFSRYRADVAREGRHDRRDRQASAAPPPTTIDADGLFVAPGIIDSHTHYDAQPFWDQLCTSSIWHGVTTVLIGNCGLTLAPLRPEHRETMLATFCCVEDLPVRSLAAVAALDLGDLRRVPRRDRPRPRPQHDAARRPQPAAPVAPWARRPGTAPPPRRDRRTCSACCASRSRPAPGAGAPPTRRRTPGPRASRCRRAWPPTRSASRSGRTLGEFNRGIIEILPPARAPSPTRPTADHLLDVAVGERPAGLLPGLRRRRAELRRGGDAGGRAALQPAPRHPVQPALHAEEDDLLRQPGRLGRRDAARPVERLAALADPERRARAARGGTQAAAPPARRARAAHAVGLDRRSARSRSTRTAGSRAEPRRDLAERQGQHVADVMLDLAARGRARHRVPAHDPRRPRKKSQLADMVKTRPRAARRSPMPARI